MPLFPSAVARLILLGVMVAGPAPAAFPAAPELPKALWVAQDGNDANPGTKAKPLRTFEGARDRLRSLRSHAALPKRGTTVWIRGGHYQFTQSFELTGEDGGNAGSPIVYRNAPGERVVLSGGTRIEFGALRDPAILERLDPVARAAVRVADLGAQGITNRGGLVSRGFGRAVAPSHLELFCGGRPMTLARWPNAGEWALIGDVPETNSRSDGHGGRIGDLKAGFRYETDRPRRWQPSTDLWVHGYWSWDWANSYERVESIDLGRGMLRTAAPHGLYGFRKGQRFFFLNVLEELDTPGEYYLDAKSGRLYFWPPFDAGNVDAVISLLESPLLRIREASHVVLEGFGFEAGRGHGVEIHGGREVRIVGCRLRNLGNHGVWIDGGQRHEVVSSDVFDTGDGGVVAAGGDRQTLEPGSHWIENCHFQRQGRWSKCYVPAISLTGVGHIARHNLIHDHPHCGILFWGNDHTMEFNEIHHVALETGDVGAIYTGRDWTFRGNRIVHNYIHETGGVGMGSMGIYLDDCVSGVEVFGNVFRKVPRAVFLGGGRDHRVENNLFLDCQPSIAVDGRGLDRSPVWHDMVYQTMKDRLAAVPAGLYQARYPAIADLTRYYRMDAGVPPEGNRIRRNIAVGGSWLNIGWHARTNMVALEDNLVDEDPGFVDREGGDFRLRKSSAARLLDFQPIPFAKIGLQQTEARQTLRRLHGDLR